jgi:rhamnosyltransferase
MAAVERPRVTCIVVTFDPDRERFNGLLAATRPQVDAVLVVDNGSSASNLAWLRLLQGDALQLLELGRNTGVAGAQNFGIAAARRTQCDFVLLLDHDSVPAADMVAKLLGGIAHARSLGSRVAAAGPRYLDSRHDNPPPFIRIRGVRVTRCRCDAEDAVVEVDYLIASGCLIPMPVLDEVGDMREELFIDYVDIEWGLRARAHGFRSYGVCAARMSHHLGEHPIRFLGMEIPLHSPLRHYYLMRNAVTLYRDRSMPMNWKFADGIRLALKYGFYPLFAPPRMAHLRMMTLGIRDGLLGKGGQLNDRCA